MEKEPCTGLYLERKDQHETISFVREDGSGFAAVLPADVFFGGMYGYGNGLLFPACFHPLAFPIAGTGTDFHRAADAV